MANAPKPGVGRRIALSEEMAGTEDGWIRIVCERDGKDITLRASSIGPSDEQVCQAQAGVDVWQAMTRPDNLTNIAAVYWMARRKNGERDLQFKKVVKTFPNVQAVIDAGIDVWVPDEDTEADETAMDPTPSGPASDPDGLPSPTSTASTPGT